MSVVKRIKKHFKEADEKKSRQEQKQLNRPPKALLKKLHDSDDPADSKEFMRLQKEYGYGYLGPAPNEKNRVGKKKDSMDSKDYKEGGAVHTMPDGTLMKGAKHGMKHGGSVKGKCKVDGIAIRGRTKAKHK
tara:strand:- start:39 stop:434 length:396 start_codon:yes stop_codon:yes gene_type:complete